MEIILPADDWKPRIYQEPLWWSMESGIKRAVAVWHRRAGKDLVAINWCATQSQIRRGLYWHMFPTYKQGRSVVWEGQDKGGRPFLDAFPEELYYRKTDQDMTMYLKNGSMFQVVGTDHIDRLMGANPIGVILSEYPLQNPAAWDLIRPMLAENGGWAIFPFTPRGHNHGYSLYNSAKDHPETWFAQKLTVEDTFALDDNGEKRRVVSVEAVQDDRDSGMPEELIQQEYFCSFEAALVGSYYSDVLSWMAEQTPSRITNFAHDEAYDVVCGFDLGYADSTAIWFAQQVGHEFRLIDFYECAGKDPAHYVKVMRGQYDDETRHMSRYRYGDCWLPHDAKKHNLGSDSTVEQQFRRMGLKVRVGERFTLSDQHAGVRKNLRQTWIEKDKCERGLMALKEYVKQRAGDLRGPDNEILYRDAPVHNWASHGASAMATLLMNYRPSRGAKKPKPNTRWIV